MLTILKKFFSGADGSMKGFLNAEELYRSLLTSFGSATVIGVLIVILQAILTNVGMIFPNPAVASLATALLTLVLDLLRRQSQESKPAPSPTPPVH